MELTIALLFFSVASAACLQFFVKAHSINEETGYLEDAHSIAVTLAEGYRADGLASYDYADGSQLAIYYDDSCNESDITKSGSIYLATVAPTTVEDAGASLQAVEISVCTVDDEIIRYSLTVMKNEQEVEP